MNNFRYIARFAVFSAIMGLMLPANAVANFDSIRVSNLSGSNDSAITASDDPTGSNFTDDIFLESLSFDSGNAVIPGAANFAAVARLTVLSGREDDSDANVNGESGINDDNSDGDPDNFAKVGLDITTDQEVTSAFTQDIALLSALSSRSLTEIADGEGTQQYELQITFTQGIVDNDNGNDQFPELVIFERGLNDGDIEIELIRGGTFESPEFFEDAMNNRLQFSEESNNYADTGINIRTREIGNFQEVGVIGLDLSEDFGLTSGEPVFGIILRSTDGGADINGAFLSAADISQFVDVPDELHQPIPFETEGTIGFLALGGYLWYRKHKKQNQG